MADRTIETKVILTGEEEYVAGLERIAAALRAVGEAKKELDALFGKTSNSVLLDSRLIAQAICDKGQEAQGQSCN